MIDTHELPPLSPLWARQIDQACDRFEKAWKAGQRPRLEEFLGAVAEPERTVLLRQLLLLDWEYRRRAGDGPRAGDYLERFPGDSSLIDDVRAEIAGAADSTWVWSDEPETLHIHWSNTQLPDRAGNVGPTTGSDRYELLQEVGQGGIGVVFRGRDRQLGRELAVKVLRAAYRDIPDVQRRFIEEARVGSQLQHPAIVPVYDQGWFAGQRPYFTMKLVEGHTLATLLKNRTEPGQDLSRLLGVLEQVCQAMAYAHARGVIHRDLKPANIMVGAFGEVQVMDWGFAKQLNKETQEPGGEASDDPSGSVPTGLPASLPTCAPGVATQSGALMGTPAYMPREQARGETALIDPRADVFALGAILCEILTGWPPYVGASTDEVCRKAFEADLDDAHARLDSCGADEALCVLAKRAIAADRNLRPPDAGVVAKDLAAYLASALERLRQAQLQQAAAEARAQQARAKGRAERRARRLTLALAAALLCGTTVAVWQAIVSTRAKRDALVAKQTADVREAETAAVIDFVDVHIFAAARPEGQEGGLGREVSLRLAIDAAVPYVEQGFTKQPLIEARLRMMLGKSYRHLGDDAVAAEQFQTAHRLFSEHLDPYHPMTLHSATQLGISYFQLGRPVEAEKLFEETIAWQTAKLGPTHRDTLVSMSNLGDSYRELGRHADARKLQEKVLMLQEETLGHDHRDTLNTMHNLANTLYSLGLRDDAFKLDLQTLERARATVGDTDHLTLHSMNNVAVGYAAQGRHEDAFKLDKETFEIRRRKLGPDHPETLRSMHNLAISYATLGKHVEAQEIREETLARRRAKLTSDHPDTLWSMWNTAHGRVKLGRGAEAVPLIDECVKRAAGKVVNPRMIPAVMDIRLRHFAKAKDAAGCRATADMWDGLDRTDADSFYRAACMRAVTAAVIRANDKTQVAAQDAAAEDARAIAALRLAVKHGYKDADNLQKSPDFASLRSHPDFLELMSAVEKLQKMP